jgi:ATP-dependent protease HslVU (ClpYQ) peptidase subunit
VKIVKKERDPPLFIGELLIKFQKILRSTTQVIIRGGSLSFLVGTIGNVLDMEIGWTDVGSGGIFLHRILPSL